MNDLRDYRAVDVFNKVIKNPLGRHTGCEVLESAQKIGHGTGGDNSPNTGGIGSTDTNGIEGNENTCVAGNSNSVQENHVQTNTGITGIQGDGHTITINQCPKELIEMLEKFLKTVMP
jgi:hypothetical protein